MAASKKPVPLYPGYAELKSIDFNQYQELKQFLASGESWWKQHWHWGQEFLSYIGCLTNMGTFFNEYNLSY